MPTVKLHIIRVMLDLLGQLQVPPLAGTLFVPVDNSIYSNIHAVNSSESLETKSSHANLTVGLSRLSSNGFIDSSNNSVYTNNNTSVAETLSSLGSLGTVNPACIRRPTVSLLEFLNDIPEPVSNEAVLAGTSYCNNYEALIIKP